MDSPGWKIADEIGIVGGGTRNATYRPRRASVWPCDQATRRRMHSHAAAGRSRAASRGGGGICARTRPDPPSSTPTGRGALVAWLANMAVLLREAKGNAAPVGEHGSPSGMLRPAWVEATGWQAAPHERCGRHERKARGLSIGALLGAGHHAACAAHVGADEAHTSAASSTPVPARGRDPLTGRMERPDQAGPGARGRVTTATPAWLDFSAAEAPVKALQARCPQVAWLVLTGHVVPTRTSLRASATAMRNGPLSWLP